MSSIAYDISQPQQSALFQQVGLGMTVARPALPVGEWATLAVRVIGVLIALAALVSLAVLPLLG